LAALHPVARNPYRLSNYKSYENTLDIFGLSFPLPAKDVPKFEEQNPLINVNVLCSGDDGGYVPLYVSKERDRPHHLNCAEIINGDLTLVRGARQRVTLSKPISVGFSILEILHKVDIV